VYDDTGDARLREVMDNVTLHLFDAVYDAPDGMTHLAWGARTDAADKSHVLEWVTTPVTFGCYSALITFMEEVLTRYPDPGKSAIVKALKRSFAGCILSDGCTVPSLWPKDPIFSVLTSTSRCGELMLFLLEQLGDGVLDPLRESAAPVTIHRRADNIVFKTRGPLWVIEQDGVRLYGGYRPMTHGVTHGDEDAPAEQDYAGLDEADIVEIIG